MPARAPGAVRLEGSGSVAVNESSAQITAARPRSVRAEAIAAGLLLVQKNASLYPRDHPVVRRSLDRARESLAAYHGATGGIFFINVDESEAAGEEPGSAPAKGDARGAVPGSPAARRSETEVLRAILRRHLVRRVTILPEVASDELFRFCFLLRDDLRKRETEAPGASESSRSCPPSRRTRTPAGKDRSPPPDDSS